MTDKQFCSIYTAYNGEVIDKIGQLVQTTMYGEELKELIEFFIEQAQAMEKEAHQETWDSAHQAGRFEGKGIAEPHWQTFETYWDETFKSE